MSLKIAVLAEDESIEARVAATPETVKKYVSSGFEVAVQTNAGKASSFTDQAYRDAGAKISKTAEDTVKNADIILKLRAYSEVPLDSVKKGAVLVGLFSPHENQGFISDCAKAGITTMSMEMIPRITRAQAMDVLSSQSNLAGYKAVLDACEYFTRALPMMMTAAGTIAPARVFVMGAGVAGLQAIATAKRLGAVVSATDVRPVAKEQVQSLGASFVAVEDDEFKEAESAGGYAKEMSDEYKKKQQELIEETIKKQDIVITTALIPGRPAPKLINADMVKSMKEGSVIVDMAVESGGNCALSEEGAVVQKHGVTIIGHKNIPGRLATDASQLYSKNLLNLVNLLYNQENQELKVNMEDEIIAGITLTRDGEIVHPKFTKS